MNSEYHYLTPKFPVILGTYTNRCFYIYFSYESANFACLRVFSEGKSEIPSYFLMYVLI